MDVKTRTTRLDEATDALLSRAVARRKAAAAQVGIPPEAVTTSVVMRELLRNAGEAEERALAQDHPELPLEPMTTT